MWAPPRPGLESMSPVLASRFLTTESPGKPWKISNHPKFNLLGMRWPQSTVFSITLLWDSGKDDSLWNCHPNIKNTSSAKRTFQECFRSQRYPALFLIKIFLLHQCIGDSFILSSYLVQYFGLWRKEIAIVKKRLKITLRDLVVVQLLSFVRNPWTAACQTPSSFTISGSLLKLTSMILVSPGSPLNKA